MLILSNPPCLPTAKPLQNPALHPTPQSQQQDGASQGCSERFRTINLRVLACWGTGRDTALWRGAAAGHVLAKASGERWPRCRLAGGAVNESVTYQYYLM